LKESPDKGFDTIDDVMRKIAGQRNGTPKASIGLLVLVTFLIYVYLYKLYYVFDFVLYTICHVLDFVLYTIYSVLVL
jgi:hypothetical protein